MDISVSPLTHQLDPGGLNILKLFIFNNGTGIAKQITLTSVQAPSVSVINYQPKQFDLRRVKG
ncbi:MAG: hypothetical protein RQ855_03340 [Desulfurococcales archaeon]|nr:hypothetical protein [Desulfurococcales archaeon]